MQNLDTNLYNKVIELINPGQQNVTFITNRLDGATGKISNVLDNDASTEIIYKVPNSIEAGTYVGLESVSYTHLDVYKRQNIGRGNSSAPVKSFPDIIHKGGSLDIEANKVQQAWININAVSYTHITGYCKDVIEFVNEEVKKLGYQTSMNNKGNLFIHVEGKSDKTIGLCAHVDTLGLSLIHI